MYLFIAIIFIAELIIAGTLISGILKADRMICSLNSKVSALKPDIKCALAQTRECVSCLQTSVNSLISFVKKKTSRGYAQSYKNNPDIFNSADNEKQI